MSLENSQTHNNPKIVVRTTLAKWYFQLTNRYHHEALTYLHIRADSISFSGKIKPYKTPHFSTPTILTFSPTDSAALWAAKGVLFREPLKP